jgi:hypothetical protein
MEMQPKAGGVRHEAVCIRFHGTNVAVCGNFDSHPVDGGDKNPVVVCEGSSFIGFDILWSVSRWTALPELRIGFLAWCL